MHSNVNVIEEMVNKISASRSYQNNVEMMNTADSGDSPSTCRNAACASASRPCLAITRPNRGGMPKPRPRSGRRTCWMPNLPCSCSA